MDIPFHVQLGLKGYRQVTGIEADQPFEPPMFPLDTSAPLNVPPDLFANASNTPSRPILPMPKLVARAHKSAGVKLRKITAPLRRHEEVAIPKPVEVKEVASRVSLPMPKLRARVSHSVEPNRPKVATPPRRHEEVVFVPPNLRPSSPPRLEKLQDHSPLPEMAVLEPVDAQEVRKEAPPRHKSVLYSDTLIPALARFRPEEGDVIYLDENDEECPGFAFGKSKEGGFQKENATSEFLYESIKRLHEGDLKAYLDGIERRIRENGHCPESPKEARAREVERLVANVRALNQQLIRSNPEYSILNTEFGKALLEMAEPLEAPPIETPVETKYTQYHDTSMVCALLEWNPEKNEVIYLRERYGFKTAEKVSWIYRIFRFLFGRFLDHPQPLYDRKLATHAFIYENIKALSKKQLEEYLRILGNFYTHTGSSPQEFEEERKVVIRALLDKLRILNEKFNRHDSKCDLFKTEFAKALLEETVSSGRVTQWGTRGSKVRFRTKEGNIEMVSQERAYLLTRGYPEKWADYLAYGTIEEIVHRAMQENRDLTANEESEILSQFTLF